MNNVSPAYQHYAKEFLAETAINTLAGRGMYVTLLDHYWLRDGLPNNTVLLARLCGVTHEEFLPIWESEVKQYFHDNGEKLEHFDLIGQKDFQEAKREKAKASADKRWNNQSDNKTDANAMRTHMPTQCTATSIANTKETTTSVVVKKKPPTAAKQTDEEFLNELQNSPAYKHISILVEFEKAKIWCRNNNRQPTRKMFIGWINRIQPPMETKNGQHQKTFTDSGSRNAARISNGNSIVETLIAEAERLDALSGGDDNYCQENDIVIKPTAFIGDGLN
jgi:uncharacterized protein YdaU (DUF1376 family)